MQRIKRAIMIAIVLVLMLSTIALAYEDFMDGYTETDTYNKISLGNRTVTVTNILGIHSGYVYKDYGVDYFDGDLRIQFGVYLTASAAGSTQQYCFGLGNSTTNGTPNVLVGIYHPASPNYPIINASGTNTGLSGTNYQITAATQYWVKVTRDKDTGTYGTWYVKLYSDEAMTTQITSWTGTATNALEGYQYLFAYSKAVSTGTVAQSTVIRDLIVWPELIDENNAPYYYNTTTDDWEEATWNAVTARYEYDSEGLRYYFDGDNPATDEWVEAGPTPPGDTEQPIETWGAWVQTLTDNWKMVLAILAMIVSFLYLKHKGAATWLASIPVGLIAAAAIAAGWFPTWLVVLMAMVVGLLLWKGK